MASLVDGFFEENGAFDKIAGTYLSYENIRQKNDANGSSQDAMLNTPSTTTQTQNDPATQTAATSGTIAGLSTPVALGVGAAGVLAVALLLKR